MGAFHQQRGSLQVLLWVRMKLSVLHFQGCTASPLVLERGANSLLRARTPELEASFLCPCSTAGGFFPLLRFFCDFLKLATVVPEGRRSSECCSGGAQCKHPFSQPGWLIHSEQGDAGALPQSLHCYTPARQIKLLLLKLRVKKCKDRFPSVPLCLVVKSSSPFLCLSALVQLCMSLPPQYPLRWECNERKSGPSSLLLPGPCWSCPSFPPSCGALQPLLPTGATSASRCRSPNNEMGSAATADPCSAAVQAVGSRTALGVVPFPKNRPEVGVGRSCVGALVVCSSWLKGKKKTKPHVSSVPLC